MSHHSSDLPPPRDHLVELEYVIQESAEIMNTEFKRIFDATSKMISKEYRIDVSEADSRLWVALMERHDKKV